jgi:hypothetical protein
MILAFSVWIVPMTSQMETIATELRTVTVEPTVPNARLKTLATHAAPDTTRLSTAGATAVLRVVLTAKMPLTAAPVTKTTSF